MSPPVCGLATPVGGITAPVCILAVRDRENSPPSCTLAPPMRRLAAEICGLAVPLRLFAVEICRRLSRVGRWWVIIALLALDRRRRRAAAGGRCARQSVVPHHAPVSGPEIRPRTRRWTNDLFWRRHHWIGEIVAHQSAEGNASAGLEQAGGDRSLKNRIASSRNAAKSIDDLCQQKSASQLRSAN